MNNYLLLEYEQSVSAPSINSDNFKEQLFESGAEIRIEDRHVLKQLEDRIVVTVYTINYQAVIIEGYFDKKSCEFKARKSKLHSTLSK